MIEQRMKVIEKDVLKNVLAFAPNVTDVEWINFDTNGFSRTIQFKANEITYKIEWWSNISYLQTNSGLVVPFENVEVSGTWPNRYKTNLQFYNKGVTVAILPLEKYKEVN